MKTKKTKRSQTIDCKPTKGGRKIVITIEDKEPLDVGMLVRILEHLIENIKGEAKTRAPKEKLQ